jgi:sulfopyruvate decarboxylase subunit beta
MADAATRATAADDPIRGATVIGALKAAGVEIVVALPDLETCEKLLWPIRSDPDLRLIQVCKEDEGISICAALSYCDKRAIMSMQHTGFLDSINAIHHIPVNYDLPVIMIVGLQGLEAGQPPAEADRPDIRFVIPALEAMGLGYSMLDREKDAAALTATIGECYATSKPHVFLFGRRPV